MTVYKDALNKEYEKNRRKNVLISDLENRIDCSEDNLKHVLEINKEFKELLRIRDNIIIDLEDKLDSREQKIERLKEENGELIKEIAEAKTKLRKGCDNYEAQIDEINKETSQLRSENASLRVKNHEVEEDF